MAEGIHRKFLPLAGPSGTQTRTFNYNDGAFLMSATNPENGTVSYTYNSNNRLATKTDAKGQQVVYTYDSYGRTTLVQRYYPGHGLLEDTTQATTYYFDSNPFDATYSQNVSGRLAAIQYYGGNCTSLGPPRTGCDKIQEMFNYDVAGNTLGKRLRLIRGTAQGDLNGSWTYDKYGSLTGVTYPQWMRNSQTIPGSNYSYSMDTMRRFNKMHDQLANTDVISTVTYGVANEVLYMWGPMSGTVFQETRTYNSLFQLTQITAPGLNIQYAYSTTQNNGKLASQTDVISGEQVSYAYDSLNRLATAVTSDNPSVTQWGQSYTYDGFGNLTDQTVIKGSAPTMHVAYNASTNRQTGDSADANGNLGSSYIYDIENRLLQPGTSGPQYAYDASNKRVWRGDLDAITYWSVDGKKLANYGVWVNGSTVQFALSGTTNVYFGTRLIAKGTFNYNYPNDEISLAPVQSDRLGSIGKFYPYGQERPSATTNDTEKFTGYYRDAAAGLDYADQRYEQPGVGRFMTPDTIGGGVTEPGSWNKYAYTRGDPINRTDANGTCDTDFCITHTEFLGIDGQGTFGFGGGGRGSSPRIISSHENQITEDVFVNAQLQRRKDMKVIVALGQLKGALADDSDCSSFLKSGIAGGDTATFNAYYDLLTGASGGQPLASAADFTGTEFANKNAIGDSSGITVNTSGAFFQRSMGVGYADKYAAQVQSLQPGTPQAQAFILLHELAHFFQANGYVQNDDTLDKQKFNNDMIWEKCSKTIQGAGIGKA